MTDEPVVAPFIPGICNISSIGSKPTCRGGRPTYMPSVSPSALDRSPLNAGKTGEGSRLGFGTPTGSASAYNPITNPIPNFSQNPYILRQKQAAMALRAGPPTPQAGAE